MVFESNLKKLKDGFPISDEEIMKHFFTLQSEKERIAFLKREANKALAHFDTLPLWEDGKAPSFRPEYGDDLPPSLAFFPGEGGERRGVIIVAPGGGFNVKAVTVEGFPVIKRFLDAGFSAALLDYRVKPYTQYVSLIDMQRAVRLLRYKADELNIRADKIAVSGGSAGGHLSALAAVHFDYGKFDAADPVDRVSSRPDAAIISYGVFSQASFPEAAPFMKMKDGEEPQTSVGGLRSSYTDLREDRDHKLFFSPEKHVRADTPPFFMWQTCDEDDPRQMFNFAKELADYGIRFEAHVFPYGPHGLGLADGSGTARGRNEHVMHWSELAIEWLEINGF